VFDTPSDPEARGCPVAHKCYTSFKIEDELYRNQVRDSCGLDVIDKSLTEPIQSNDEDYIMQVIRSNYLAESTVTIHLIGAYGAENRGWDEQRFIKRELQASLYDGARNTKNGVLGVVLPSMTTRVYRGEYACSNCGGTHRHVDLGDAITIKEFSYNFYIPNGKCAHLDEDRYCVLVPWDDFAVDPGRYVDEAYDKRTAPIASKTKVRPT
jgi:hypothetical protein